ncbi:MAG: hypothetical protein JW704_02550 [Anaerolineaceae bacterium]|nr:hypothetical protein [Anaerolineaceae bacterium]
MKKLMEDMKLDREADEEFVRRLPPKTIEELMESMSALEKFKEKHGIVSQKRRSDSTVHSIGFSEKEQKWYGWSHRAIVGFGVGDKIFDPDFGDDNTLFVKHGEKTIKSMKDAEVAARAFAEYVS